LTSVYGPYPSGDTSTPIVKSLPGMTEVLFTKSGLEAMFCPLTKNFVPVGLVVIAMPSDTKLRLEAVKKEPRGHRNGSALIYRRAGKEGDRAS